MGENLYLVARAMMWLCFLALPFSPFLLMIEEEVLRFSLFGVAIALSLTLLFTGCSLKIFNHWREQQIEKLIESQDYTPSPSGRPSVQMEVTEEPVQTRPRANSNTPLDPSPSQEVTVTFNAGGKQLVNPVS